MPLTPLQREIAHAIADNRSPGSHLAGAAALHLAANAPRTSNDLDYFHDEEELVAAAFAADRAVLEGAGFFVRPVLSQPGFIRAIVGRGGDETKVEWAHDSAWRFLPAIKDRLVGFRLHPVDLSINKVLALVGRDEPRDFYDILFVHERYLSLGGLCWAAVGKDPGYSPELIVELLARKGRYHEEDFTRLQLASPPDLTAMKKAWTNALSEARTLVRRLPPEDAGCLYLDPGTGKFVIPGGDLTKFVRHRAAKGGVIPDIGEGISLAGDSDARGRLARRYGRKSAR
jgi:hypothetical protein